MIKIYQLNKGKGELCNRVLRSLPEWFGIEDAIVNYVKDVEKMTTFAADYGSTEKVGFISLRPHNELNSEIHIMANLPDFHRKGIGKALIKEAEKFAKGRGAKFLTVKTLSPARESREYELTRKFYLSVGFLVLEEFKTLWGESNPCLLMIKVL